MTTAITRMITWLRGEAVGTDEFGNQYYHDRKPAPGGRRRRWVIYDGDDEASKVPPLPVLLYIVPEDTTFVFTSPL